MVNGASQMTITLDPATLLVALASSAVSVLATWYFSRRHYTRASRRQGVTEYDIALAEKQTTSVSG